jgi:hypothetical protein
MVSSLNVIFTKIGALCLLLSSYTFGSTHHGTRKKQDPAAFKGSSTFVPGITVYGSIIMTDYLSELTSMVEAVSAGKNNETIPQKVQVAVNRGKRVREELREIPFPVVEWPPLKVAQCPHDDREKHGSSERGLSWAHYQILLEFVYFDYDVVKEWEQPGGMKPGSVYESNSFSSISSSFVAVGPKVRPTGKPPQGSAAPPDPSLKGGNGSNGGNNKDSSKGATATADSTNANAISGEQKVRASPNPNLSPEELGKRREAVLHTWEPGLYKNDIPFREDDILVVLEDDVVVAIKDLPGTLKEEFADMKDTDLLYVPSLPPFLSISPSSSHGMSLTTTTIFPPSLPPSLLLPIIQLPGLV